MIDLDCFIIYSRYMRLRISPIVFIVILVLRRHIFNMVFEFELYVADIAIQGASKSLEFLQFISQRPLCVLILPEGPCAICSEF